MKHRLKIVVLVFMFFVLTGCDQISENDIDKIPDDIKDVIVDTLPSITIIGDDIISVEQYTTFTDPGADVTGGFDLDITVVTDLDTSVLGDYTVTYTVVYEGVTYSGTRTVRVVEPPVPIDLGWVLTTVSVTADSIGVNVTYSDVDGVLTNGKGTLYQESTLVGSYNLNSGLNALTFSGLQANTVYTFVVEGSYEDNGETITLNGLELSIPAIDVVGDDVVTVVQNTTFTDPGANVIGVSNLDVTVATDVDTSVLGDYTVTYTVVYEGITYSATRTVSVVEPPLPVDLGWVLIPNTVTTDSINVSVVYSDVDGLLTNGTGVLYQGETVVASYNLNSGINYLTFTGLHSNMEYKLVVEGSYVDNGETIVLSGLELSITTSEIITMQFNVTNETITHSSYSSDIEITYASSNIVAKKAYLYLGNTVVQELELNDANTTFSASGLLSGTEYVLKVIYTATPSSGGADVEVTEVLKTFSTDTVTVPTVLSFLCEVGYSTVECPIDIDTTGFNVEYLRIYLYENGVYDDYFDIDEGDEIRTIYNLDPGTEYTLKLFMDYRPSNSFETLYNVLLDETTITTKVRTTVVENMVITTVLGTPNTTTFEFDILDPDNAIDGVTSLTLFKGGSYKATADVVVGHNIIVVESTYNNNIVDPNTLYTVKVTTRYAENAGTMTSTTTLYEETYLTQPDVEVSSYRTEKSMYFHSDRIILVLELENDEELDIEYVVVNGETIYKEDFLFPSNFNTIYLSMGVETDYTNFYYHMTSYGIIMIDESIYAADYDATLDVRIHQPGDIDPLDSTVEVLEITADDYTKQISDSVTNHTNITIRLENEYNLDVYSITVGGEVYLSTSFEVGSTAKQIIVQVEVDGSYNNYGVSGLVFVRNDKNVTAPSSNYSVEPIVIRGYYAEDAVGISTPAELNSITPGSNKYYYLTNDIDLTGFPMQPIGTNTTQFSGIFDGKGFTISNYSYTSYEVDQGRDVYVGLFGKSAAFIYDLTIFNSEITIYTNETHQIFAGTLAGYSSGDIINVTTLGTNTITINGVTQGKIGGLVGYETGFVRDASAKTDIIIDGLEIDKALGLAYDTYVGGLFGLAGSSSNEDIETSSSDGTISITNTVNNTNHVGGLIGKFLNSTSTYATRNYISNSFASVDIYTSNYGDGSVGGLVGTINNSYATNTEVRNSYASGDIYSDRGDIGGLIGYTWAYVTNSFATGDIDRTGGSAYRLTESYSHESFFSNNYVYDGQTISYDGVAGTFVPDDIDKKITSASIDEYNSEDFYTRVLGWNAYFWDFDDLIASADILPEHR